LKDADQVPFQSPCVAAWSAPAALAPTQLSAATPFLETLALERETPRAGISVELGPSTRTVMAADEPAAPAAPAPSTAVRTAAAQTSVSAAAIAVRRRSA
jgi:hypothetical protein